MADFYTIQDCVRQYGYTRSRACRIVKARFLDKGKQVRMVGGSYILTAKQFSAMKPAPPGRPRTKDQA